MTYKKKILILGCGVSGLTCGVKLLDNNFDVEIITPKMPLETTSAIAPAYWYPYSVYPEKKVLKWGEISYKEFTSLSKLKKTGVTLKKLIKLYDREVSNPYWTALVRNFEQLGKEKLPAGYEYGLMAEVPQIEAPVYLKYMHERFLESGGKVIRLEKDLNNLNEYYANNSIIINCTGLGSYHLYDDKEMIPIRGQLIRTTNPGIDSIYNDEDGPLAITYIVPRSNDCVLGGTAQENNWDLEVDEDISENIIKKSIKLMPSLNNAEILEHKVGLRPGRTEVMLEAEEVTENCTVIHNYGHGGAGFTLSWGCGQEVLDLVMGILDN